jgi:hypothetical protein
MVVGDWVGLRRERRFVVKTIASMLPVRLNRAAKAQTYKHERYHRQADSPQYQAGDNPNPQRLPRKK